MSFSIKRVTSLLTVGLAALTNLASAEQVSHPIKLKVGSEVFLKMFHNGDQRMLKTLKNVEQRRRDSDEGCPEFQRVIFSAAPTQVEEEDYDFTVSLNDAEKGYLGFEGENLVMHGAMITGDDENDPANQVGFMVPVTKLRLESEFVKDKDSKTQEFNPQATKPDIKDFIFELGDIDIDDGEGTRNISPDCGDFIKEGLQRAVRSVYDGIWDGNMESLTVLPIESLLPMMFLRQAGSYAIEQSVSPEFMDFGYDTQIFWNQKGQENHAKKKELLKEIHSEHSTTTKEGHPILASLIIDENAINNFLMEFVIGETAYSMRTMMKADARLAEALSQMNTNVLGMILPQVIEEYGRDRAVDFYLTLSHKLIDHKLDGIKPTGFQMDKNGNFRFILNVGVTILVEQQGQGARGQWEEVRSIYAQVTAKGKIRTDMTNQWGQDVLSIVPKNAEMSHVKVFNKDEEEMDLEQMLITSAFNVQADKIFKNLPPYEKSIAELTSPQELECFHIALEDLNISFKKGYLEATMGWRHVEEISNPELCERFNEMLQNGPKRAATGGVDGLMKDLNVDHEMIADKFGSDFRGFDQAMQGMGFIDKGLGAAASVKDTVNQIAGEEVIGNIYLDEL